MSGIKLSPRLNAIANLIPKSGGIADVGTDHGYIPVWLAQNGYTGQIFATDIRKGPLSHAKQTALEYGLDSRIDFRLCDGLEMIHREDVQTVVIAGMGGENIAAILSAAQWTRQNDHLLILQPMTKSHALRSWLFENGYKVLSEMLVEDGAVYEILTAVGGKDLPYSPAELLIGHRNLISEDALFISRLDKLIEKESRAKAGLCSSLKVEDKKHLSEIDDTIDSLLQLKSSIIL